jgi:uncharacterized protein YhdP
LWYNIYTGEVIVNHQLEYCLKELNEELLKRSISIEMIIIGAYALQLHQIDIGRETRDLDNVTSLTDEVLNIIDEIAIRTGNIDWYDKGAVSITLP